MLSSIPFLVTTFFIYAFISEIRNLHGKCLMSYVFSFAILYATSSIIELNNKVLLEQHTEICTILGYLWMTAILCCCFWSNVLCFDIWRTFKSSLYMRLAIVMGIHWIVEVSSSLIGDPRLYFVAFVLFNMQGPIIFLTFVCNTRVKYILNKRFNKTKKFASRDALSEMEMFIIQI
ncbi:G-protein coupled receptor Mth2-like [Chironomus tepperi]|uniref:G-protein coupled receptor Mth2-like n=1 Tax=Chironomus tepperi TaxID=113505 RepID=UPI00391F3D44